MKSHIPKEQIEQNPVSGEPLDFLLASDENGFHDEDQEHHKKFDNGNHYWIDF